MKFDVASLIGTAITAVLAAGTVMVAFATRRKTSVDADLAPVAAANQVTTAALSLLPQLQIRIDSQNKVIASQQAQITELQTGLAASAATIERLLKRVNELEADVTSWKGLHDDLSVKYTDLEGKYKTLAELATLPPTDQAV